MSCCFKVIEENIRNLRFSIEFDVYDFDYRQQNILLNKIDDIQKMINEIKESRQWNVNVDY